MSFSVGILDTLFGQRITLEIPNSYGNIVRRSVTKKWYELIKNGTIVNDSGPQVVKVHLLDMLKGYQIVHWVIDDDIEKNTALKLMDETTGDLYAIFYFDTEEPRTEITNKNTWTMVYNKICQNNRTRA